MAGSLGGGSVSRIFSIRRASKLIARHNSRAVVTQYGVPDLFLYAVNNETGLPSIARFVEVMKPEERVSTEQRDEIAVRQALG